jgi:uncharacterized protein involved in type VI secretion and phage assembly
VKVEFQWQKDKSKTTNWIRVKTPDAGKSDKVPKNRGFVFIPEKDDIVMIDFEYGDPNRPYVSGSIFSEKVSRGGDDNNKIKSIITRGDSSMTFDDDKGSIVIKDQKGSESTITFDGKHNIIINATSSIILNSLDSGRIELNAKDIILSGNESISLHSPKITIGDAGGKLANMTIDLTGEEITLTGGDSISEEAPKIDVEGKNTVDVSTQKMKLSGSTKIDISAPRINSN